MTYQEALQYIHSVNWTKCRPSLGRIREMMDKMDNPDRSLRFIHIGGTNGKGSTSAMMAAVLQASGYTVGLYTSPFINHFGERMQINGEMISHEEVALITEYIKPIAESLSEIPSEFDIITAMAMEFFKRHHCDIVVLEVGMGGEFDSTNFISTPVLTILTAMGYDHTKELGDTMTEIATAKSGIIKTNSDVVCYGQNPEAMAVFSRVCRERHCSLTTADFSQLELGEFDLDGQYFSYKNHRDLRISLPGSYQPKNAAVVLEGLDILQKRGWHITEDAIRQGFSHIHWPARFEVLRRHPVFIVDGGHNPHGIQGTLESLQRLFPKKKITFLMGLMADKDWEHMISPLFPLAARFFTAAPNNPRAISPQVLADAIQRECSVPAIACDTVESAVDQAIAAAGTDGVICALGSLYMAGRIRTYLQSLPAENS